MSPSFTHYKQKDVVAISGSTINAKKNAVRDFSLNPQYVTYDLFAFCKKCTK